MSWLYFLFNVQFIWKIKVSFHGRHEIVWMTPNFWTVVYISTIEVSISIKLSKCTPRGVEMPQFLILHLRTSIATLLKWDFIHADDSIEHVMTTLRFSASANQSSYTLPCTSGQNVATSSFYPLCGIVISIWNLLKATTNNVFCEVAATFDIHILISSSFSEDGCLCHILRNALRPWLSSEQERCSCIHRSLFNQGGFSSWVVPKTQRGLRIILSTQKTVSGKLIFFSVILKCTERHKLIIIHLYCIIPNEGVISADRDSGFHTLVQGSGTFLTGRAIKAKYF